MGNLSSLVSDVRGEGDTGRRVNDAEWLALAPLALVSSAYVEGKAAALALATAGTSTEGRGEWVVAAG